MNNEIEKSKKIYNVPAVDQAIRVMLCLADGGSNPKSLTDICREVGIHRSKAFSILNTLQEHGFVKKNPNRKGYILGPGLLTLAGRLLANLSLPRVVESILYDLAKKAGATVALGVISDDETFVVAQYEGAPGMGISSPIGYVTPITYGAHGKAIAAFLPEDELEELLKKKNLYFYGTPEKYDKARLLVELAIAVSILDQNSKPVGYITLVGFFTQQEALRLGPLTVEAVKVVSAETGHMIFWQRAGNRRKIA
jgi:DNA-binding IclR family transcriptional regulator